jgi:hypothetical protein
MAGRTLGSNFCRHTLPAISDKVSVWGGTVSLLAPCAVLMVLDVDRGELFTSQPFPGLTCPKAAGTLYVLHTRAHGQCGLNVRGLWGTAEGIARGSRGGQL